MTTTQSRCAQLPNRRRSETFSFECAGLRYTATTSWFHDGRLAELFLNNHNSDLAANVNARDSAITLSLALQNGTDVETIRTALCRDSHGGASGPLGPALDRLARDTTR
jgi:hypothetical protein